MNASWELLTQKEQEFPLKRDKFLAAIVNPYFNPWPPHIWGRLQYAYGFIENNITMRSYLLNAHRYWSHISCGSTWMKEQHRIWGIRLVR